jgi:pimeloyl-ACP methyl ester carboxylesterase
VLVAGAIGVVATTKAYIHHERLPLIDTARKDSTGQGRSVPVDFYVRWDKEMRAENGMIDKLPVVIISHGNTVPNTRYSFAAKSLALRGYLVLSIQHDLETDPKLPTIKGELFVGREASYKRSSANIDFVLDTFKRERPFAEYENLTLLGHSQGGDVSVYYAYYHPDTVGRVVTFDNLRVSLNLLQPDLVDVLSVRGNNIDFVPDPGVVPKGDCTKGNPRICESKSHHTTLTDDGSEEVQTRVTGFVSLFLDAKPHRRLSAAEIRKNFPATGDDFRPPPAAPY